MIALEKVLNLMQDARLGESQKTFSIKFLKCNRDKKTGGELVTLARAQKHGLKAQPGYKYMVGIYDVETGQRMAVHEKLIFQYQGQEVFL